MTTARASDLFPEAVLLVDRPAIAKLFDSSDAVIAGRLAVVCADGSPSAVVAMLQRGFRAGERASLLYVHDATTVLYPFAFEPLASLVEHRGSEPIDYVDLGLPPLGTSGRRFGDPAVAPGALVFELAAIPPATLVRYCTEAAARAAAERVTRGGDPRREA